MDSRNVNNMKSLGNLTSLEKRSKDHIHEQTQKISP